jgi:Na+/H+ antiporter NhaD/arsenite permease-like protein
MSSAVARSADSGFSTRNGTRASMSICSMRPCRCGGTVTMTASGRPSARNASKPAWAVPPNRAAAAAAAASEVPRCSSAAPVSRNASTWREAILPVSINPTRIRTSLADGARTEARSGRRTMVADGAGGKGQGGLWAAWRWQPAPWRDISQCRPRPRRIRRFRRRSPRRSEKRQREKRRMRASVWLVAPLVLAAGTSGAGAAATASLPAALGLPFAGLLLCIAILPLATPSLWHHHYGKIAAGWSVLTLAGFAMSAGTAGAAGQLAHTVIAEYLPFLILVGSLYVVAGGLYVTGNLRGSPAVNTAILAIGAVLANLIGTTGAAMVLIRPLIRANDERRHNVHVVIFFIFIVANVAGSLTPLGDPPLFLGFLQGVGFFWTTTHILPHFLTAIGILLAVFFVLDSLLYRLDARFRQRADPTPARRFPEIGLQGKLNLVFLAVIVAGVLMSGLWQPGVELRILGVEVALQDLARDALLVAVAVASYVLTPKAVHEAQDFSFGPIVEVAKLFAGIFVTMMPVLILLRAGRDGPFAGLVALTTQADGSPDNALYFWLAGGLSSFLDNAPTYLVFFNLAGGDAATLQGPLAGTLTAISAGAVFMGANSYIGNAPNFMVKAIAEERGIRMPSFFGYMAWSVGILIPIFLILTWLYFT